jgi:two-component system cell cycle sensor histidine kinase/response regulator CckA
MPNGSTMVNILVVDDEPLALKLCTRALAGAGYRVITASEGPKGLQLCKNSQAPIHLALLDVMMPEMTGPELAKELESLNSNIVIMLMSGFPKNDLSKLLGYEVPDRYQFVEKPFLPSKLVQAVADALADKEGRDEKPKAAKK